MEAQSHFLQLIGRLRLRHLALLDWLGREPNIGRAAKKLHMSQPTASKLLREIEDIFDAVLFTRHRRGLTPTLAGRTLCRRASILLAEMQAAHAELLATRQGAAGRLRIGIFPVAVPEFLPCLYTALQNRWPGMSLSIIEAIENRLLDLLSSGEIDCIIGRISIETLTPDLCHEALYGEPTSIVCGVNHPILKVPPARHLQVLQQTEWLLPAQKGPLYNMVAARLASLGVNASPRIAVETASVFVTTELIHRFPFFAILPKRVAQSLAQSGKIALVPMQDLISHYAVGIIYRLSAAHHPLVQSVLQAARECAATDFFSPHTLRHD